MSSVQQNLRQAYMALQNERFERAESLVHKVLQRTDLWSADYESAWVLLARILYQKAAYQQVIESIEAILSTSTIQQLTTHVELLNLVGNAYRYTGELLQSKTTLQRALALYKQLDTHNNVDEATLLNNLAGVHYALHELPEAIGLYEQSLSLLDDVNQPEQQHLYFAITANLADTLRVQGAFMQSLRHYQNLLKQLQRNTNEHANLLLTTLNNVASLCQQLEQNNDAETCYQLALTLLEEKMPKALSEKATLFQNLATLYRDTERLNLAEPLLKQALIIRQNILGSNHPDVAITLNNLGQLYELQGQYTDASTVLNQALEIQTRVYGDNHVHLAPILSNLGEVSKSQQQWEEAEYFFKQALACYDSPTPNQAIVLFNLAQLFHLQNNLQEAQHYYQEAHTQAKAFFSDSHPLRQSIQRYLNQPLIPLEHVATNHALL